MNLRSRPRSKETPRRHLYPVGSASSASIPSTTLAFGALRVAARNSFIIASALTISARGPPPPRKPHTPQSPVSLRRGSGCLCGMNTLGNDRTWKNSAIGFFLLRVSWMKRNERWFRVLYCIVWGPDL